MAKVEVNGVRLWYELTGSGPHVIQVPGAVSAHEGYAAVTPSMAERFTVVDFDPRGYGQSDRPKQRYTFDTWADDMIGLLDALEIERAHMHGGSMGSMVALRFSARYPERVHGLVLSGCAARSDFMARCHYEVWKALARVYGTESRELAVELCNKAVSRAYLDGPMGGEHLVRTIMDVAGRNVNVDVFCDACDTMIDADLSRDLAAVRAPTLVMVGDQDVLTPAEQGPSGSGARVIYEGLVNAAFKEFVIIAGAGHANLLDSPDASTRTVIDFLERVAS